MKILPIVLVAITVFAAAPALRLRTAPPESPVISPALASDNRAAAIEAARARGAAEAAKDIAAGDYRILYYGIPWSVGKPLVDDQTGYPVRIEGGCVMMEPRTIEIEAYNRKMREHHAASGAKRTGVRETGSTPNARGEEETP